MGSAHSSYVNPETAITALVVVGAVALGYNQIPTSSKDATPTPSTGNTSQKKGKKGKGKGKENVAEPPLSSTGSVLGLTPRDSVSASTSLPGQFDADTTPTPNAPKKAKKKGKKLITSSETHGDAIPSLEQSISASIDFLNASEIQLASSNTPGENDGEGKKKKKKAKGKVTTPSAISPSSSQTIPPQPPSSKVADSVAKVTKSNKAPKAVPSSSTLSGPTASSTSLDTDGSWTRVGAPRRGKGAASADASAAEHTTTSGTGTSSPVISRSGAEDASLGEEEEEDADDDDDEEDKSGDEREFLLSAAARVSGEDRKTLAERLVPKPRKTHVEDMLTTPDYPTLARVVRVRPGPDEKPAQGFSWGDYEDVRTGEDADIQGDGGARTGGGVAENEADDDDGWGVVTSKKAKRVPSGATATPSHKATKASETLTKKQRQNLQRNEEQKAAKASAEAERLAVLAQHKSQLENERIKEQFGLDGKGKKAKQSGGMVASVDDKGRLVWE